MQSPSSRFSSGACCHPEAEGRRIPRFSGVLRFAQDDSKTWLATLAALLVSVTPARAFAQACCAGGSVITPGRLAMHEDALVGLQEKAGNVLGSYSQAG